MGGAGISVLGRGQVGRSSTKGRALTRGCRDFSVVLNFKEPGGHMSSV